jgi:hypothetical protein
MMKILLGAAMAISITQSAPTQADDERAVRVTLDHYLLGQATGDPQHYRRAFHPEARLFGVRNGRPEQRTLEEYLGMQSGRPAADEAQRRRQVRSVGVSGDAAVATIVLDYPAALTTDYMSLIRSDGEWHIVHKLYNVQSRARPAESDS